MGMFDIIVFEKPICEFKSKVFASCMETYRVGERLDGHQIYLRVNLIKY